MITEPRSQVFIPGRKISAVLLLALIVTSSLWLRGQNAPKAEEPTTESVFAEAPFEKWKSEGPHQDLPWKITMTANQLSFHQRLIALVQVSFPVHEILKEIQNDHLTLLIEVRNGQGVSSRSIGGLELGDLKPDMKRTDIEFSWVAFAVPGQYEVTIAAWDKNSGKHNFMTKLFHVDAYKHDLPPEMWNGLSVFEFWSDNREGPEYLFHSDIEGRLNLPLKTKRPLDMELLLDLTPSADIFRGNVGYYNRYLAGAIPMFKVFSQIDVANGSRNAETIDVAQKRVAFKQTGGKNLNWENLRKALSPDNNPGTVSIQDLQNKKQNPIFLREEIVRRLSDPALQVKNGEKPLHVFVLIGEPMDMYAFPQLPAIETGNEEDCLIYYLQFNFFERPRPQQQEQRHRFGRFDRPDRPDRPPPSPRVGEPAITGNAKEVEKMLKPLKMRTFQVSSPDDVLHALNKIMEELGKL